MKRMKLEKKNILKAVVAFAVAMAFIMPGAASVANDEITISDIDEMTFAGTTIYVDDSNTAGPWNGTIDYPYQYIQDGINAANAGDTIIVYDGIYNESISVNTANLTLKSQNGRDNTIIQNVGNVPGAQCGFLLMSGADNFMLGAAGQSFTFSGGTSPRLIQLDNAPSGVEISYNKINTTGTASTGINIGAAGAVDLTISNNIFIADEDDLCQDWPLSASDGSGNIIDITVTDNEFTGSGTPTKYGAAISLSDVQGTGGSVITNNTIIAFDRGIIISTDSTFVTSNLNITQNMISDCTIGIRFKGDPSLIDLTTVIVKNNNISGNLQYGLKNEFATGDVNATNNYWGHTSGPYHPTTNPNGLGDNVSDNVEFAPWIGYYSWDVTMNITEQNGFIGDNVIFGEKPDAFDTQDRYDKVKPNNPPAPYVYAWFDAGLPEPYDILWEDYRRYPDDYKIWDLYIECDTTQPPLGTVNLIVSWNITDLDASEYDRIGLYDLPDGMLVDMKEVDTYMFTAEFECTYHFQIRCSVNIVPNAYDDFYMTLEGMALLVPSPGVLANDVDIDGDPLTAILESNASNGTVTLYVDGSFEYIPDSGFSGYDIFTYKANDGMGNSTPATVTVTVTEYCHVPLQKYWNLISLPVSESIEKSQIIVRSNGTDYTWEQAVSSHIILDVLHDWNRVTQCYAIEESAFKPGRSYWMWAYQDCELLVYSDDAGTGHITTLQLKWSLVGFPYDMSLAKEDIIVYYAGVDYTWDEATTDNNPTGKPIILGFIYGWERDSQRYVCADGFDAGVGYWMYAYKSCTLTNPLV